MYQKEVHIFRIKESHDLVNAEQKKFVYLILFKNNYEKIIIF